MKFLTLLACIVFSGSMALAHCGSCGTGDNKKEEHSHSDSKEKKHKCGKKCKAKHKMKHKHAHDKKTNGHKAHSDDH
jgi:hypothetical protein